MPAISRWSSAANTTGGEVLRHSASRWDASGSGDVARQCSAANSRRSDRCIWHLASRRDAGVNARPIPAVALR